MRTNFFKTVTYFDDNYIGNNFFVNLFHTYQHSSSNFWFFLAPFFLVVNNSNIEKTSLTTCISCSRLMLFLLARIRGTFRENIEIVKTIWTRDLDESMRFSFSWVRKTNFWNHDYLNVKTHFARYEIWNLPWAPNLKTYSKFGAEFIWGKSASLFVPGYVNLTNSNR